MHLEPFGLSVHAFGWTGQENIIPTCREAGNYYIIHKTIHVQTYEKLKFTLKQSTYITDLHIVHQIIRMKHLHTLKSTKPNVFKP